MWHHQARFMVFNGKDYIGLLGSPRLKTKLQSVFGHSFSRPELPRSRRPPVTIHMTLFPLFGHNSPLPFSGWAVIRKLLKPNVDQTQKCFDANELEKNVNLKEDGGSHAKVSKTQHCGVSIKVSNRKFMHCKSQSSETAGWGTKIVKYKTLIG